jgi:serine phosphatase RsbU (regulator of sigma subunit)
MKMIWITEDPVKNLKWREWLPSLFKDQEVEIEVHHSHSPLMEPTSGDMSGAIASDMICIDEKYSQFDLFIRKVDSSFWKKRSLFVILENDHDFDYSTQLGRIVDGAIAEPLKKIDVLNLIRLHQRSLEMSELIPLTQKVNGLIEKVRESLELTERLQRKKIPNRFDQIRGIKASYRYLSGLRSGGDYFDCAQNKEGHLLTIVMTDASSYGLSSLVLSSLVRVSQALNRENSFDLKKMIPLLTQEIQAAQRPKDQLSLFYGVLNLKTLSLEFVQYGSIESYVKVFEPNKDQHNKQSKSQFQALPVTGEAIHAGTQAETLQQTHELKLHPQDQLVILSDGWKEYLEMDWILSRHQRDGIALANDLDFEVKRKLKQLTSVKKTSEPEEEEDTDYPAQDCTLMCFEIESRVIRLTDKA